MKYKVIIVDIHGKPMGFKEFKSRRKANNYAKLSAKSRYFGYVEVVKTIKKYRYW